VLGTLPPEEYASGLGEVVKYALLDGPGFLADLETQARALKDRDPGVLTEVVFRCVAFKAAVVGEDEHDRGRRATLNLGHTAGHALEVGLGYGRLSHGTAVGLGLLVALAVSENTMGTDPGLRVRVRDLLVALGLPVAVDLPGAAELLGAAAHDKKVTAAGRGFVCLRAPGEPVWGVDVSTEELLNAFEVIRP
jgi:3-dehydroquinate synthase